MAKSDMVACRVGERQTGVTFGFYARNGIMRGEWLRREVDRMVELGVGWVVLTPVVLQDHVSSCIQYRDFEVTPNDHDLYEAIDLLHDRGLHVQLRPMLETQDGHGRLGVWFPADGERIPGRPSDDWSRWFHSFTLRSVHYARIAADTGCEMFGLDSELDRTVHQHEHYKRLIEAVRGIYNGRVTSCHTTHAGRIDWPRELSRPDHWWRELDELHLSCYEQVADGPGATVEQMAARFEPARDRFRELAALYGKPLAFGEIGCTSSAGGAANPSGWRPEAGFDGQEQANYLEAFLRTFWDEPWWAGLYWWKWDEQNDRPHFRDDPRGDKGFTVWGKPAAEVMRRWFARGRCTPSKSTE